MTPIIESAWRRCAALAEQHPEHQVLAALERAAYWLRHTRVPENPTRVQLEWQRDSLALARACVRAAVESSRPASPAVTNAYDALASLPRGRAEPQAVDHAAESIVRAAESLV